MWLQFLGSWFFPNQWNAFMDCFFFWTSSLLIFKTRTLVPKPANLYTHTHTNKCYIKHLPRGPYYLALLWSQSDSHKDNSGSAGQLAENHLHIRFSSTGVFPAERPRIRSFLWELKKKNDLACQQHIDSTSVFGICICPADTPILPRRASSFLLYLMPSYGRGMAGIPLSSVYHQGKLPSSGILVESHLGGLVQYVSKYLQVQTMTYSLWTLCPLLPANVNLALSTLHITVDTCIHDDVHSDIFWKYFVCSPNSTYPKLPYFSFPLFSFHPLITMLFQLFFIESNKLRHLSAGGSFWHKNHHHTH